MIMHPKKLVSLLIIFISSINFSAQSNALAQTVRGTVIDQVSTTPIVGATVIVKDSNPIIGCITDENGAFRLLKVPVGKITILATFTGYKATVLADLNLISGKELVLNINLEEDISVMAAVEIVAETDKKEAINSMSSVSTRTFSVEETQKFAAAINDPSRMATSFAGVVATDDGNNNISIRGNSPYGLLWRMEGIDIPNPNHFSNQASSGGGVSILSSQLLANSDFMTGAFTAEYGNALSGVFDLKLRKGNTEKREYTFQAGFLGIDAAVEGPFSKNYGGSYLINYRYSTLSVISKLGVPLGDAVTNFQDISFNFYLPTQKAGNFSLFGFGGKSDQVVNAKRDSTNWTEEYLSYDQNFYVNTGAIGVKHVYIFNEKHYIQTTLLGSGNMQGYTVNRLEEAYHPHLVYNEEFTQSKLTLSSVWNWKLNSRNSIRTGVYLNRISFDLFQKMYSEDLERMQTQLDATDHSHTVQGFSQWKSRITEKLTFIGGVHSLYMKENNRFSIEPRAAIKYQYNPKNNISIGYGLHSQIQPVGVYHALVERADGTTYKPNENLDFNKAHHLVLGYDHTINKHLHAKVETYYQQLFHIAVQDDKASSISTLNMQDNYLTYALVNQGSGKNYGVELTVEKFTSNNMYFLLSASLFESKYKALDGQWRDTRYNIGKAITFSAGKEWKVSSAEKNRVFGFNIRAIYTGGQRRTPINLEESIASGQEVYNENLAWSLQTKDYFRTDIRFSLKRNKVHSTNTLSLDLQNATNNKNIGGYYYDKNTASIKEWFMVPLIPVLSYRVEF